MFRAETAARCLYARPEMRAGAAASEARRQPQMRATFRSISPAACAVLHTGVGRTKLELWPGPDPGQAGPDYPRIEAARDSAAAGCCAECCSAARARSQSRWPPPLPHNHSPLARAACWCHSAPADSLQLRLIASTAWGEARRLASKAGEHGWLPAAAALMMVTTCVPAAPGAVTAQSWMRLHGRRTRAGGAPVSR